VPLLAAVVPVLNGTRVSIRRRHDRLRHPDEIWPGRLARLIGSVPLPITLRQAINNVNQKKFRLALTGTTLTVAVGAFMGIYAVFSSLSSVVDDIFNAWGWQIGVTPSQGQNFDAVDNLLASEDFRAKLAANGVTPIRAIEPGGSFAVEIEGYDPPPSSAGPPEYLASASTLRIPNWSASAWFRAWTGAATHRVKAW